MEIKKGNIEEGQPKQNKLKKTTNKMTVIISKRLKQEGSEEKQKKTEMRNSGRWD
jgi:hypothetical protein